jgi:hypothetical protein
LRRVDHDVALFSEGYMGTAAGAVGKQTVERLGVFDDLLHAGADGVLVWCALGQRLGGRF